jgi:small ligand-binding sensory domain FIST
MSGENLRIGAGLSTAVGAADATIEAAREAAAALGGAGVDLAFLFISPLHLDRAAEAVFALREELAPRHLVGCVADGVLAGEREIETGPAVAVWAASLPGAEIETFHAVAYALEDEDGVGIGGLPELDDPALVALLVDPFTFPAAPFLRDLNEQHPGLPIVGGVAAGGGAPGAQALILDDEIEQEGAVGVVVSGIPVRTVVSQGCSPFGREAVITRAEENVVYELAGERAIDRLREDVAELPEEERRLVAQGILAGLVINENKSEYGHGDFLIRGLVGADDETGAIAIGEEVRVGQTLRFHYRDAGTADYDLREGLALELDGGRAAGALVFTCNGRGTHMFDEPGHDARAVSELLRSGGVGGMFCGGEIGPVGGRAFLHGFTATLAVFLDR